MSSEEAARRLGVTVKTLYVYVSRGRIESHRKKGTRPSFFSEADVERLAGRSRRRAVQIDTFNLDESVTSLRPDGIRYRGERIERLIDRPFEEVAELLWQADAGEWDARVLPVPKGLSAIDQVRCGVVFAGAADPLRSDQRPEAIVAAARRLLTGLARTLARGGVKSMSAPASIAHFVAAALLGGRPSDELVATVDKLMVLLADHSIATSTLAVRVAASNRVDLYSAISCGLGAHMGPLFGASSEPAVRLLRYASEVGVDRAIDEELRWRGSLSGFGVPIYPERDPRFEMVFPSLERLISDKDRDLMDQLLASIDRQQLPGPNADLAVALLVHSTGADAAFAPAVFAIARMAGWVAHYLEELKEPFGRYYMGPTYPSNWLHEGDRWPLPLPSRAEK